MGAVVAALQELDAEADIRSIVLAGASMPGTRFAICAQPRRGARCGRDATADARDAWLDEAKRAAREIAAKEAVDKAFAFVEKRPPEFRGR